MWRKSDNPPEQKDKELSELEKLVKKQESELANEEKTKKLKIEEENVYAQQAVSDFYTNYDVITKAYVNERDYITNERRNGREPPEALIEHCTELEKHWQTMDEIVRSMKNMQEESLALMRSIGAYLPPDIDKLVSRTPRK